jgi:hypothetical protein
LFFNDFLLIFWVREIISLVNLNQNLTQVNPNSQSEAASDREEGLFAGTRIDGTRGQPVQWRIEKESLLKNVEELILFEI